MSLSVLQHQTRALHQVRHQRSLTFDKRCEFCGAVADGGGALLREPLARIRMVDCTCSAAMRSPLTLRQPARIAHAASAQAPAPPSTLSQTRGCYQRIALYKDSNAPNPYRTPVAPCLWRVQWRRARASPSAGSQSSSTASRYAAMSAPVVKYSAVSYGRILVWRFFNISNLLSDLYLMRYRRT